MLRRRKLGKERVPERVLPGRSCCFSFCLSLCLSQTGLRFRDYNHIFEFVFVECVSGTYLLRSKKTRKKSSPGKGGTRFWKSIVLGFKTPREAIKGMSLLYVNDENPFFNGLSLL
ncbi:40S ribosomal protein S11 [Glycine max]|nr:40S ribosomal protein S11 [Glycine max]